MEKKKQHPVKLGMYLSYSIFLVGFEVIEDRRY